jgi:transcriptional regulator with XRE-family HTH domain
MNSLAQTLQRGRVARGLNASAAAARAGISPEYWRKIECGTASPRVAIIRSCLEALGLDPASHGAGIPSMPADTPDPAFLDHPSVDQVRLANDPPGEIRRLREAAGLSLGMAGARSGWSKQAQWILENRVRRPQPITILRALAGILSAS